MEKKTADSDGRAPKQGEMDVEGEKDEGDGEIYCGLGQCRPQAIQGCANIKCITIALALAGLSTSTLNVYINSQITTLERQFGFSSSVSGFLLSCNDLGFLLTTLFMSYLARRLHIPRALSLSTLLFGLSGLFCTLPFFASLPDMPAMPSAGHSIDMAGNGAFSDTMNGTSAPSNPSSIGNMSSASDPFAAFLCRPSPTEGAAAVGNGGQLEEGQGQQCGSEERQRASALSEDKKWLAVTLIAVGMVFQGFGKSPRYPFIGTYIDDNVPKTKTTLYLGIISSCSIFGPMLAFTLGGLFSRVYVTLEDTSMSPRDPRWVGAWWLGFLVFGSLGVVASVSTMFFPRRLRPQPHLKQLERDRKERARGQSCGHHVKEFLRSLCRLVRTPVYVCLVLGTCSMLFGISGMLSFLPKYLETQFLIPAWKANIILGVLNILSAAGGTLVGGIVTSRLKMSPRSCLKMMVVVSAVSLLFASAGFFLGCEQPDIRGSSESEVTTCQANCRCDVTRFFPVCGSDDVTYFSPCHAGCVNADNMRFGQCACVNSTMTSFNSSMTSPATSSSPEGASPGFCATSCAMLYPYAAMNFLGAFSGTLVIMPSFIATVRSVSEQDKPLSIGLSSFCSSFLGWFLGPIVFGRIVDTCCLLWSSGCDKSGSCALYDLVKFRFRYHALFLGSRVVGTLLFLTALLIVIVRNVQFSSHRDNDVIMDTLPAEGESLMQKKTPGSDVIIDTVPAEG